MVDPADKTIVIIDGEHQMPLTSKEKIDNKLIEIKKLCFIKV